jgi:type IV pilus assembly protein PilM
MAKKKPAVGLDIGSCLVKFVEIQGLPKTPSLANYGMCRLLPDAIVDGEIMDREVVIDTVKTLFETRGEKNRDVAISVSGRGVIVKKITMERMKESEAQEQIRWEAEQHIPFDINDVSLDFQIVNPEAEGGQMEVLLVAAKAEIVNSRLTLLREAGLNPIAVDVACFAVQNAFEANYEVKPGELIAIVNIGSEVTSINFVQDSISHFTRDISQAGNDCSQRIQKNLGLSTDQAMDVLKGERPEDIDEDVLQSVFQSFSEDLSVGIERVLPYLPGGTERMDRIVLAGGGATIPGLASFLSERFGVPVEILDPLKKISFDPALFGTDNVEKVAPILSQAIGLALRG